jgi:hypothetical protein
MFKKHLELVKENCELKSQLKEVKKELEEINSRHYREISDLKEKNIFEIEKAKFEKAKEMEKDLVESDLKRVEAVAKLNTYIDMDTKEERKHIQNMLRGWENKR